MPEYQDTYIVRAYEVTYNGLTTITSIGNYLQETAGHHATALGVSLESLMEKNVTWVLTRMRIHMERYPASGEEVRVVTWPSERGKMAVRRDFKILDSNDEIIGVATTAWSVMDLTERTMIPMPEQIIMLNPDPPQHSLDFESRAIPRLKIPEYEKDIQTRETDLDTNNHINNVHYLEWAIEAIPFEAREGYMLSDIDVMFRAEGRYGDIIKSQYGKSKAEDSVSWLHSLLKKGDDKELARLKTAWKKI